MASPFCVATMEQIPVAIGVMSNPETVQTAGVRLVSVGVKPVGVLSSFLDSAPDAKGVEFGAFTPGFANTIV